jgi:hypothetical protein
MGSRYDSSYDSWCGGYVDMIPFRGINMATVVFLGMDVESLVWPIRVGSVVGCDGGHNG